MTTGSPKGGIGGSTQFSVMNTKTFQIFWFFSFFWIEGFASERKHALGGLSFV
jgi:hypothetical protein